MIGPLAEPVREITVASTLQRMLLSLVAVGADVDGSPASPRVSALAVGDMQIAGSDREGQTRSVDRRFGLGTSSEGVGVDV